MMRVLLLSGELSLRGSTLYTVSLARELKLRGHRVAVLGPGGLFEGVLESHRIPLLRAPVHGTGLRDLLYLNTWTRLVREFDPHVLHLQNQDLATVGTLVGHWARVPTVITVHARARERLRFLFAPPPQAIAVSEDVRQSLVTGGSFPRESIEIIPNGVSASLSALEDDSEPDGHLPVVGTVNRIAADRGIDDFLQAARRVLDREARACFLVIGEGPQEREVRALSRRLDLNKHVTFALVQARAAQLFRSMDYYVSASHTEGHGIFLLAAMAEARPIISTGVGGVLGFLHDRENGLVVQRGDVDGLASAILELLEDPELGRRLAREGFRHVREHFPLHQMVERTLAAYRKAQGPAHSASA